MQSEAQREQALRRFAESGANPIITTASPGRSAGHRRARLSRHQVRRDRRELADLPNVRQVSFAEHEGSYLVGVMAAMASESDTVGFVGGMDVPIRYFGCGYAQGQGDQPDATSSPT